MGLRGLAPTNMRHRVSAGQVLGNIRGGSAGKEKGSRKGSTPRSDVESPTGPEKPLPPLHPQDSPPRGLRPQR